MYQPDRKALKLLESVQLSNSPLLSFSLLFATPFYAKIIFCFVLLCFWFQYIIFTLYSQSNYFFILNHHYQIGSNIIRSIWQCNVQYFFLLEPYCCVCMTGDWRFSKLHTLLLRMCGPQWMHIVMLVVIAVNGCLCVRVLSLILDRCQMPQLLLLLLC